MPSTPKYSRSSSPDIPCKSSEVSVAPYLTHILTHHGQLTLVPPQSQGRLRTNKKPRKAKSSQVRQPCEVVHTLPTRPASPMSSTSPHQKKVRKSRETAGGDAVNAPRSRRVSLGNLGEAGQLQPGASSSSLPPPPSYDSIRLDVSRTSSNDVITPASNSSSGFEDITEMDFESQWEMDRMAGFTLEERVRREWYRLQAAVDRQLELADCASQSRRSSRLVTGASLPNERPSPPPEPPPKDHMHVLRKAQDSLSDSPCSGHVPTTARPEKPDSSFQTRLQKGISSLTINAPTNSSGSSFEDWDVLEPILPNRTHSLPSCPPEKQATALSSKAVMPNTSPVESEPSLREASSSSDVEPFTLLSSFSSPGTGKGLSKIRSMPFDSGLGHCTPTTETTSRDEDIPPLPSIKGKEREICNKVDDVKLSAIHSRPLPTPPIRTSLADSTGPHASSSHSHRPEQQDEQEAETVARPLSDGPMIARAPFNTPMSIRDRITKFESMRDRPVPPPPLDFLKNRAIRKPPPPPPSSFRLGDSDVKRSFENEVWPQGVLERTEGLSVSSFIENPRDQDRLATTDDTLHSQWSATQPSDLGEQSRPPINSNNSSPKSFSPSHGNSAETSDSTLDLETSHNSLCVSELPEIVRPALEITSTSLSTESPAEHEDSTEPTVVSPVSRSITILPAETSLSQYTDLDVLLSRLDDASSGNRYEDLLLVSDILGPARLESPNPSHVVSDLPLGKIEVVRRRKLQDGRVKLKLSLLGVMVDRCLVCLSQFKDAEWAVLLPCLHPYHSTCLQSWLVRSHTCPLCRVTLDIPT